MIGFVCRDDAPFFFLVCAKTADVSAVEKYFGKIDKIVAGNGKVAFIPATKLSLNEVNATAFKANADFAISAIIEVL